MMRSHRRLAVTTIIAVLVTAMLAGCSADSLDLSSLEELLGVSTTSVAEAREQRAAELTQTVSDDLLNEAGTLTVGIVTTESTPLVITASDGTQEGIDIDMAYALADALGLSSVKFVSVTSASSGLSSDGCDIVMGVSSDEAAYVTVLGSYAQSAVGVFTCDDVTVPIDTSALSGATVGVQASSVSQSVLEGYGLDITEEDFTNLNEAFEALSAGTVDYVVCDAYAGAYLATMYDEVSFAGTLNTPTAIGVAVSSDATELASAVESAITEVLSNGVADLVRYRWVEDLPSLSESTCLTSLASDTEDASSDTSAE